MPITDWDREIEEPSGVKARGLAERAAAAFGAGERDRDGDADRGIGGFAFPWGAEQERTPTWHGLFTPDGRRTASVDVLTKRWTGEWPTNRAPLAHAITLDGRAPVDGPRFAPGATEACSAAVRPPRA